MAFQALPDDVLLLVLSHQEAALSAADLVRLRCVARFFRGPTEDAARLLCARHRCARGVPRGLLKGILSLGFGPVERELWRPSKGKPAGSTGGALEDGCRLSWIRSLHHLEALDNVLFRRSGTVAAGSCFSLCVSLNGEVYGFGSGSKFGLGEEAAAVEAPVRIPTIPAGVRIVQVAAGWGHSLFLSDAGEVFAVGDNGTGSLGLGRRNHLSHVATPQKIDGFHSARVVKVAAGNQMSAAIDEDGKLFTFGGTPIMLGHGDFHDEHEPRQVAALDGKKVHMVSIGLSHVLAIADTGKNEGRAVYSWGFSDDGALGLDVARFQKFPKLISGFCEAPIWPISVSAGRNHSLALLLGGNLLSWGNFVIRPKLPPWMRYQGRGVTEIEKQGEPETSSSNVGRLVPEGIESPLNGSCSSQDSSGIRFNLYGRSAKDDPARDTILEASDSHSFQLSELDIANEYGPEWGPAVVPSGCLGHPDNVACCRPKLVQRFIGRHIVSIAAGWYVSYAVTDLGDVLEFGLAHPAGGELKNALVKCDPNPSSVGGKQAAETFDADISSVAAGEKFESISSSFYDIAMHTLLLSRSGRLFSSGFYASGQLGLQRKDYERSFSGMYISKPQEIGDLNLGAL